MKEVLTCHDVGLRAREGDLVSHLEWSVSDLVRLREEGDGDLEFEEERSSVP